MRLLKSPLALRLKEVVISGSRNEQATEDVPASIEVLNAEALEAQQVRDIRDAVRDLPNVSVQRSPSRFNLAQSPAGRNANAEFQHPGPGRQPRAAASGRPAHPARLPSTPPRSGTSSTWG